MNDTIRAFVAIELPEEVKTELGKLLGILRGTRVRGLRLVRLEGIHLTLKFLGNIPMANVEPITVALHKSVGTHSPFKVQLGEVGVFPNRRNPRVLWAGVQENIEALVSLQSDIDETLTTVGFAKERREFTPHLTLARIREGSSPTDSRTASETLFLADFQSGLDINVGSVSLIRSTLKPDGAIYESLASVPLNGGSSSSLP